MFFQGRHRGLLIDILDLGDTCMLGMLLIVRVLTGVLHSFDMVRTVHGEKINEELGDVDRKHEVIYGMTLPRVWENRRSRFGPSREDNASALHL